MRMQAECVGIILKNSHKIATCFLELIGLPEVIITS